MSIINLNPQKSKPQDLEDDPELVPPQHDTLQRRILTFVLMVLGILANLFLQAVWGHLADPLQPIVIGPVSTVGVRLLASICIAGVTFLPIYQRLAQQPTAAWLLAFRAFQMGFFWQAAFSGITQHFS